MSCLEAALRVIDPGMNHLAVVRARAETRPRLAFQDADAAPAARDGQRRRQTNYARSDHCYVDLFHRTAGSLVKKKRSARYQWQRL